jgi:integrase
MPSKSAPSYLCHASGQAFSRVKGKNVYFGIHGSPESLARYDDFKREWLLQHGDVHRIQLTVDELALLYISYAENYYRKNGEPTSEVSCVQTALRFVVREFGTCRVLEFGPIKLKQVRQAMMEHGICRESINKNIDRIRRMFRWGVENEKVPPDVLAALVAVRGLGKGRSNARETEPVKPVPIDRIEAIQPYVKPPVWAMIRVQLLTGARPGEVLIMRGCDLDMTGSVWTYVPSSHKTEHHGRGRTIFIGPKAQAVIRPFLKADPQAYLFSPRDVCKVRRQKGRQPGARYVRMSWFTVNRSFE